MTQSGYMVRAGNDNELISTFESNSFVAIGWVDAGDVSEYGSYEAMKAHFRSIEKYAEYSTSHLSINAGQVFRFAHEISTGDIVLTYDKTEREYLVGRVKGDYQWQPADHPPEYPH